MNVRTLSLAIFAIMIVALAACSSESPTPTPAVLATTSPVTDPTPTPEPDIVIAEDGGIQFVVHMAYNGSPQTGTATFTQRGQVVNLRVRLSPSAPVQKMVLRRGDCSNIGGYIRDLDSVIGGVSNQEIRGMGIERLIQGDMTLVIGRGSNTFTDVASCAELPVIER